MRITSIKLRFVLVLSSLALMIAPLFARAHEVTPTIADLTVKDGIVTLDLRMNVEAFVAGIDLDGLADTNSSDLSDSYDSLRALSPDQLSPVVQVFAEQWLARLRLTSGPGRLPVVLQVADLRIPAIGNVDLPRPSHLILTAELADTARSLQLYWPPGSGNLVLRQVGVDDPYTGFLAGGDSSPDIFIAGGANETALEAFLTYIPVGFDHILPKGLDHILFVLGLFFLSRRLRPLVWQVSAFTLAHTMTLALGAMGWVQVSPQIVEPLIAASIVYVAVENVLTNRLHRWRPVVIFGFGLLHGLGFASVLGEFGLPQGQFLTALLGFNVGVELGQLTVIAIAFLSVGLWFGRKPWYRGRIAIPASIIIAMIGAYWFVERVFL
jgi:HupE/UreJ protein